MANKQFNALECYRTNLFIFNTLSMDTLLYGETDFFKRKPSHFLPWSAENTWLCSAYEEYFEDLELNIDQFIQHYIKYTLFIF